MRHHVSLDLAHEVHRHNDHDQQRGAAEIEGNVEAKVQELRHKAHEREIHRTSQRETHEHLVDVPRRLFAGTNAGNERTALFQVLCRFLRVEDQRRVEVGKEDDECRIKKRVKRLAGTQRGREIADPARGVTACEPPRKSRREQNQRRRENRGNHTGHIHLQRQVRSLAAVDLVADLTPSVVHRDAPLAAFDEDHEGRHENHDRDHEDRRQGRDGARAHKLEESARSVREPGHDAGEDDDRNAVAETAFRDLLTEPHQEHRAGHETHGAREAEHQAGHQNETSLTFQSHCNADRLEEPQKQRAVARVLSDLATAGLAFLTQRLKTRQHIRQHLHDDRCRDVGHDAESEHREARQRATGEHVEQPENAALLLIEELTQHVGIDTGNRHMRADAVHNQSQKQEDQATLEVAVLREPCRFGAGAVCHVVVLKR